MTKIIDIADWQIEKLHDAIDILLQADSELIFRCLLPRGFEPGPAGDFWIQAEAIVQRERKLMEANRG